MHRTVASPTWSHSITYPSGAWEQPDRTTLTRELSDFLIELSIALNKHGMYPDGHPSLVPAAGRVRDRVEPLLAASGTLSLGVAKNRLVIEGVATDPSNPVLRELAGKLHRHHLGAVMFRPGVEVDEIRDVLSLVAIEPDHSDDPLGLGPPERLTQWEHITLYPMHYDRLHLDESESEANASRLWIGLAQAALALDEISGEGEEDEDADPASVATAINQRPRDAGYEQVIVGYMLQIAEELRAGRGKEAVALKRKMSNLIEGLDPRTLDRLLAMGGDPTQRRRFVLNAAEGLAADAVVDLVAAAGNAEQQTVSHSLLRMLQKLGKHAETGAGRRQEEASGALREQVQSLVTNWTLKDPNPDAYRMALSRMSEANSLFAVAADQQHRPEPRRIIEMALEVDVMGEQVERAADRLALGGELKWLLTTIETAGATVVPEALWSRLATPDVIGLVLQTEPVDTEALDLLLPHASAEAADTLLDALTESESAKTRSILLERLPAFGRDIGKRASARLSDNRWYVRRNMLKVIGDLGPQPEDVATETFLRDADARVRLEALRIQLHDPAQRERALGRAIRDADDKVALMGLRTALAECPTSAIPPLVSLALSERKNEVRSLAVRVLGEVRHTLALDALLTLTRPRRRLLRLKTPPKTPVYLAALKALQSYHQDERVQRILQHAARSRDPDVAAAATAPTVTEH